MAAPEDMPRRVADALRDLGRSHARLLNSNRYASAEAVAQAEAVIRDLAKLAGVDLPEDLKRAA